MKYIAIAGTGGANKHDWFLADSDLSKFFSANGCVQLEAHPLWRYMWSTELDGIRSDNTTWDAAGRALAHYIKPPLCKVPLVTPSETYIIAHSHGGNVVAYACGKYGLKINGLVTVGTPIRKDLYALYKDACSNISRHIHLYAGWRDWWQIFGSLFDGQFGMHREHPFANWNVKIPEGNHGSILRDEYFFPMWLERGWLSYWREGNASRDN